MARAQENLKEILAATRQIRISVRGRKTGQTYSYLVWFVLEGRRLYLLPVHGSDTQWYRNLLRNPAIEITARARASTRLGTTTAKLRGARVTRPAAVKAVIRKFGEKYKARIVRKLYFKFDAAVRVQLA